MTTTKMAAITKSARISARVPGAALEAIRTKGRSGCVPAERPPSAGAVTKVLYAAGRHSDCSAVHAMSWIVSSSDLSRSVYRVSKVSKLHSTTARQRPAPGSRRRGAPSLGESLRQISHATRAPLLHLSTAPPTEAGSGGSSRRARDERPGLRRTSCSPRRCPRADACGHQRPPPR